MKTTSWVDRVRLQVLTLVSSLLLVFLPIAAPAHKVTPTIADLQVEGGVVVLALRLNVEAFLAGIDLDGIEDTDESDRAEVYDRLRRLAPEALADKVRALGSDWATRVEIRGDGGRGAVVGLNLESVEIGKVGDSGLPRESFLVLKGAIAREVRSLTLTWAAGSGDLVLRQQGVEDPYTGYLAGGETSPAITLAGGASQTGMQAFAAHVPVGFDHVLPKGLDHILFVLGLFFLSARLGPLLWQVTAFTVAYSVTLALGATGMVPINAGLVEPLIAATIVLVAMENVVSGRLSPWRPVMVFGFGLLHGLGFAAALEQLALPDRQFVPALLGFNVGVELGLLAVIVAAFLLVGLWFGRKSWYRGRIAIPASMVIAFIGGFWFVQRVFL